METNEQHASEDARPDVACSATLGREVRSAEAREPVLRGKTVADAVAAGMHYSNERACPECGCPWYGNKDECGVGHRTCYDCKQEWWADIRYAHQVARRELPAP